MGLKFKTSVKCDKMGLNNIIYVQLHVPSKKKERRNTGIFGDTMYNVDFRRMA